ncbi:MAG: hypothetical protein QF603_12865, partial [Alphaproteobacteria bacterium]|nr:hypothetical protein [Alphaproteobacteria bacterium]
KIGFLGNPIFASTPPEKDCPTGAHRPGGFAIDDMDIVKRSATETTPRRRPTVIGVPHDCRGFPYHHPCLRIGEVNRPKPGRPEGTVPFRTAILGL